MLKKFKEISKLKIITFIVLESRYNYFIIFTFMMIVIVAAYTNVNIMAYAIFELSLLTLLSFSSYILSQKS